MAICGWICPASACSFVRTIHRVDRANSLVSCAVLFLSLVAVLIDGKYLYALGRAVAFGTPSDPSTFGGKLDVFDISIGASPSLVGSTYVASTGTMLKYGALLSVSFRSIDNFEKGIQLIDVSNPLMPRVSASTGTASCATGAQATAVVGTDLYTTDGTTALAIIGAKFSLPDAAKILLPQSATGIASSGSTIFVTQRQQGVVVFDTSTPHAFDKPNYISTDSLAIAVTVSNDFGIVLLDSGTVHMLGFFAIH